jgi:hypothetical protein
MLKAGNYVSACYKVQRTTGYCLHNIRSKVDRKAIAGFCMEQEKLLSSCEPKREAGIQGWYEIAAAD